MTRLPSSTSDRGKVLKSICLKPSRGPCRMDPWQRSLRRVIVQASSRVTRPCSRKRRRCLLGRPRFPCALLLRPRALVQGRSEQRPCRPANHLRRIDLQRDSSAGEHSGLPYLLSRDYLAYSPLLLLTRHPLRPLAHELITPSPSAAPAALRLQHLRPEQIGLSTALLERRARTKCLGLISPALPVRDAGDGPRCTACDPFRRRTTSPPSRHCLFARDSAAGSPYALGCRSNSPVYPLIAPILH